VPSTRFRFGSFLVRPALGIPSREVRLEELVHDSMGGSPTVTEGLATNRHRLDRALSARSMTRSASKTGKRNARKTPGDARCRRQEGGRRENVGDWRKGA
jgi:hypothetical protein